MKDFEKLEERFLRSEKIFDGQILHLRKDTVQLPNGKEAFRETIRHIGAVAVVPMTEDGKIVVEQQFRYPIAQVITEIPAGKLDHPEENRLEAAKRELEEETGLTADHWQELGEYYPSAAYCDERITLYLATGLHQGKRNLDEDEFLNIRTADLEELVEEIMQGKIIDGKTQTALLKVHHLLKK